MSLALKDLVPGIVRGLGISEKNFAVLTLLEREIHKIAPLARVAAFKNGKVYVEVESSVHLYELSLRKREILKILSAVPGVPEPELKFFIQGNARPSAAERSPRRTGKIQAERN